MTKTYHNPGQISDRPGQYEIVGPRGGKTGHERTVVKDKRFPPTPYSDQKYELVDPTKTSG